MEHEETNRVFTDEEIVKALECCATNDESKCKDCPYYEDCTTKNNVVSDTLNLINRLRDKSVYERLYYELLDEHCDLISRLTEVQFDLVREYAKKIKSKSELVTLSIYAEPFHAVSVEEIDKVTSEMTEREKGKKNGR